MSSDVQPSDLLQLVEPWDVEELGTVMESRIFTLRRHRAASRVDPSKRGEFFYLDTGDWVNVIAVTRDDRVVTIEQFRHGTREITLEVPGGMCDPGEAPLVAGVRELREETGFAGGEAEVIGVVTPNPALQNNRCHTVLVRDVERRHELDLDGNEEIAVRLLPFSTVWELLRTGAINHALVVAAFAHYSLRFGGGR